MTSEEAKRRYVRAKLFWRFKPRTIAILGFLLCVRTSDVSSEDNVCLSNACLSTASTIRECMNSTVEPCDDFYEFACGGFVKSTVIPGDTLSVVYLQTLGHDILENLTHTLANGIEPNEPKFSKLSKKLFQSCTNPASSGIQGLGALKQFLSKLGGWPVLDGETWDDGKFDWRQMIYKFEDDGDYDDWTIGTGIGHLIGCSIRDHRRLPKRIITLSQPPGLLPRGVGENDYNGSKPFLRQYYDFLVDLAMKLGAAKDRALKELRKTVSFEIQLANIKTSDGGSGTFNPMTIAELQKKFTSVPWMEYVRKFVSTNVNIKEDEIINVEAPEYYVKLEDLMAKTPKRVQANYVLSRVAIRNAVYSNEQLRRTVYNYLSLRHNVRLDLNRTKWCTNQLMQNLKVSISGIYAREYFDKESRNDVTEMLTKIKREALEKLLQSTWMDEKTKRAAKAKYEKLVHFVGHPDETMDDGKLNEFYENLEFNDDDFFGNMEKLSKFDLAIGFKRLREPVIKTDWRNRYPSTMANALYSPLRNSIEIFAGILHGLYFDKNRPKYLNYGAIGSTIGHEITHGFYESGRHFDQNGKYNDWWQSVTENNFQTQSQCLIRQYENYVDDDTGLHLNGQVNLSENIADIGGTKLAYDTYKKWAARNGPEPLLPGFEKYSASQMFWISKASVECAKYDTGVQRREINVKEHTLNKFRVNGPVSNMPEFAEDFQCRKNSPMNPETKCTVW